MSELQSDHLLAYLTEVRGNGMEARIIDAYTNAMPLLKIDDEEILAGHVGAYVVAKQGDIAVMALVFKIWENYSFNQHGERKVDRYVSLIPVGEVQEDGTFVRGVRHYPTPGAEVYAVGIQEINAIFSRFREYGFYIGQLTSHKDYQVSLDPKAFFGRHFAVIGQSWCG